MFENVFSEELPSHQASLDLFKDGWISAMPEGSGLNGGSLVNSFIDGRVTWAAKILGGLANKTILELGPFEAYNTFQFEKMGANGIISIEGSAQNFIKCLIVKNIFNLSSTFLFGDFNKYLTLTKSKFDICWASGVLYHLTNPLEFLEGISSVSDTVFVWTQYYDSAVIKNHPEEYKFSPEQDVMVPFQGRQLTLHSRYYKEKPTSALYSAGSADMAYWMELDDILYVLQCFGFSRIEMGVNNPNHPPGPACFFLAFRD